MDYVISLLGPMSAGALVTLKLFFITLVLSIPLGLALALMRISSIKPLSSAVGAYIWLMRGTPLMLQLLFVYFALPFVPVVGVRLPDFPAAVVAFALNYAAYFAEIFRAGIKSIDRGQTEAALSLGFNNRQTMAWVILPQAWRTILPPVGNEFIALLKDTSLVSILAVADILRRGREYASESFNYFETYTMIALIYLLITLVLSKLISIMEHRLSHYERR